jgi:hypothetical protein
MTVALQIVSVPTNSPATAPLIEGATPSTFGSAGSGVGYSHPATTGRIGFRIALTSATDFTTHDFASFQFYATAPSALAGIATIANGGRRIIFVDGSGSYAGYNIYGTGIPNYVDSGADANGFWATYNALNAGNNHAWHIAIGRTPDISSGVIDWTNIVAVEVTINLTSSRASNLYFGLLHKHSGLLITGTETLATAQAATPATGDRQFFRASPYMLQSVGSLGYNVKTNLYIGNGSIATNWTESGASLGFFNTWDKSPTYRSVGPMVLLDDSNTRGITINQSASDVLALTDYTIASAGWWTWTLMGSGSATLTRVNFIRYTGFAGAHGTYTDCDWAGGEAPVQITASTNIVRGTMRDGDGMQISGAAGDYSDIDVAFGGNSVDITLGSGGAGTYSLTGISAIGVYTIKIHNDSATNAVVVELAEGIAYSTTTAGGTITVQTPQVYQSVVLSNGVAGSRVQLYDVTSSAEIYNDIPASWPHTWTDSVAYAADREIRLRVMWCVDDAAKRFIDQTIGTCTEADPQVSYLINQSDDEVYNANAIDGSGLTGYTITGTTLAIEVNDGSATWPEMYAYEVYWLSTEDGIRDQDLYIEAIDTANYVFFGGFKIKNTSSPTQPLLITGGNGEPSSGPATDLLDTTGGTIFCNSAIVVPYSSGAEVTEQIVKDGLSAQGYTPTKAGYLDAAVSTRLATSAYTAPTAPDNAGIAAIKAKTDLIPASPAAAGEYTAAIAAIPTATDNADAVWSKTLTP